MASTSAAAPTSKGKAVAGPAQVKKAVRTHQFEPGVSLLPISRVHRIIKADKDIKLCSKEAIFLISKATEFFLGKLTNMAYSTARLQKRSKTIKYSDLSSITTRPEWHYLGEIIPSTFPLHKALALRVVPAEGSTSTIEPSDKNHPYHPSSSANGAHQGMAAVKKGRKKSLGGAGGGGGSEKPAKGNGSAIPLKKPKKKLAKNVDRDDEEDEEEEEEEEHDDESMDVDV